MVADPHTAVGLLLELGRRLDETRQVRELGAVDADVGAVALDDTVHPLGQRLEHVCQGDVHAVDGHLDLQVEPVGASRVAVLPGREVDDGCAVQLAVVGLVADLVDLDLALQTREQLLGEQDRVRVVEHLGVLEPHPPLVAATEVVLLLLVQGQRLQLGPLHVGPAYAAQAAGLGQLVDPVVRADPVAPGPLGANLVGRDPRDGEREPWLGGLGHGDRAVGRDDGHVPLETGKVLGDQVVAVGRRHHDRVAALEQPSHLRSRGHGQRRQGDRPRVAVGQPEGDRVAALTEHVEVGRAVPLTVQRDTEPQLRVPVGGGVHVQLQGDRVGERHVRQPRPGEQRHPRLDGPADEGHLVGPERAQ